MENLALWRVLQRSKRTEFQFYGAQVEVGSAGHSPKGTRVVAARRKPSGLSATFRAKTGRLTPLRYIDPAFSTHC